MKYRDHGIVYCIENMFADDYVPSSLLQDILIWGYDDSERSEDMLTKIYYDASLFRNTVDNMSSFDFAFMNILLNIRYKHIRNILMKSNRPDEFKNKLPRKLPKAYNIYNLSDIKWLNEWLIFHRKSYSETFMERFMP